MNAGNVRVVVFGWLLAVGGQNRQALANTGGTGTLKHRETVVDHQGRLVTIGGAAGKVLPERRVLFGLAQFVAGDDAVNMLIQSGPLKLQGQRIWMAVGDDDRAQSGLAQCGQEVGYMGAVANAVANPVA